MPYTYFHSRFNFDLVHVTFDIVWQLEYIIYFKSDNQNTFLFFIWQPAYLIYF